MESKHPIFSDDLLPVNNDIFKPEFRRDSRGSYFMQLPGYGKWMVSNEPGSKIIAQSSEDEKGGAATNPASLMTGSLSAETVISVGQTIKLDGTNGSIVVGESIYDNGTYALMSADGIEGISGGDKVFGLYLRKQTWDWRIDPDTSLPEKADKGDVMIGDITSGEYLYWNDDEGKLYIKGDLIIEGDIVSANYPTAPYYWLDYDTGDIEISGELRASNVTITGGDVDNIILTGLLAGTEPSIQGWSHTMVFTAVDWNTLSWTSGAIRLTDGTPFSVNPGSFDMTSSAPYYIYYDGTSTLATTTLASSAVGSGKILICVAKRLDNTDPEFDASKNATFQVFGNEGLGTFIVTDNLAANAVTANEIHSNSIQTRHLIADQISATHISSLLFSGKDAIFDKGTIGGWSMSVDRLWKTTSSGGNNSKIELNVRAGTGVSPHIQIISDTDPNFATPTGVQLTNGQPSDTDWPNSRIDIYDNGKKRVLLNKSGLQFFQPDGLTPAARFYGGNSMDIDAADIKINPGGAYTNGMLRMHADGFRAAKGKGFFASALDNPSSNLYNSFDFYCDSSTLEGIIQMPSNNDIKIGTAWTALAVGNYSVIRIKGDGIYGAGGQTGGPYVLDLFGPLRLYNYPPAGGPYASHPGNTSESLGCIYYSNGGYVAEGIWVRLSTGWTQLGGGGGSLPTGNAYDMMRCSGGTTWQSTADVYWGAASDRHIWKDPSSPYDTYLSVPSGTDFAFQRGGVIHAKIDDNFWTKGNLFADGQLSVGGTIQNTLGDIICNNGNLQLKKAGAIVAVKDSGGTTRYLTCQWNATLSKYILSS